MFRRESDARVERGYVGCDKRRSFGNIFFHFFLFNGVVFFGTLRFVVFLLLTCAGPRRKLFQTIRRRGGLDLDAVDDVHAHVRNLSPNF
jgi:hypothetical protein